jgi:hypothetical protein
MLNPYRLVKVVYGLYTHRYIYTWDRKRKHVTELPLSSSYTCMRLTLATTKEGSGYGRFAYRYTTYYRLLVNKCAYTKYREICIDSDVGTYPFLSTTGRYNICLNYDTYLVNKQNADALDICGHNIVWNKPDNMKLDILVINTMH